MEPMKDSVIIITCNCNRLNFLHDMRMIINAVVFIRSSFDGETKTKCLLSSRLETRTKESNMCASVRSKPPNAE